jgi:hypothetical protein
MRKLIFTSLLLLITHTASASEQPIENKFTLVEEQLSAEILRQKFALSVIPKENFDFVLFRPITSFSSLISFPINNNVRMMAGLAENQNSIGNSDRSLLFSAVISYSF